MIGLQLRLSFPTHYDMVAPNCIHRARLILCHDRMSRWEPALGRRTLVKGLSLAVQLPFRWDDREGWTFITCATGGHSGGEGGGEGN